MTTYLKAKEVAGLTKTNYITFMNKEAWCYDNNDFIRVHTFDTEDSFGNNSKATIETGGIDQIGILAGIAGDSAVAFTFGETQLKVERDNYDFLYTLKENDIKDIDKILSDDRQVDFLPYGKSVLSEAAKFTAKDNSPREVFTHVKVSKSGVEATDTIKGYRVGTITDNEPCWYIKSKYLKKIKGNYIHIEIIDNTFCKIVNDKNVVYYIRLAPQVNYYSTALTNIIEGSIDLQLSSPGSKREYFTFDKCKTTLELVLAGAKKTSYITLENKEGYLTITLFENNLETYTTTIETNIVNQFNCVFFCSLLEQMIKIKHTKVSIRGDRGTVWVLHQDDVKYIFCSAINVKDNENENKNL